MGDPTFTIYAEVPPQASKEGPSDQVPENYKWKPLGRGEEVRAVITNYFPDIKWHAPENENDLWDGQVEWQGTYQGEKIEGWSEFSFRDEPCNDVFVKCCSEHSDQLMKLCAEQGWFLYSHTLDCFMNDPDDDQTMEEFLDKALDMLTLGEQKNSKEKGLFKKLIGLFR